MISLALISIILPQIILTVLFKTVFTHVKVEVVERGQADVLLLVLAFVAWSLERRLLLLRLWIDPTLSCRWGFVQVGQRLVWVEE